MALEVRIAAWFPSCSFSWSECFYMGVSNSLSVRDNSLNCAILFKLNIYKKCTGEGWPWGGQIGKSAEEETAGIWHDPWFFSGASELNILLMAFIMQQVTSLIHLKNSFSSYSSFILPSRVLLLPGACIIFVPSVLQNPTLKRGICHSWKSEIIMLWSWPPPQGTCLFNICCACF